jgi:hypothetical protein
MKTSGESSETVSEITSKRINTRRDIFGVTSLVRRNVPCNVARQALPPEHYFAPQSS